MRAFVLILLCGCTARANGEETGEKDYTLTSTTVPSSVTKEVEAKYQLTITPKSPWVLKTTTPMKVELTASDGVSLKKAKLDAKDIADPKSDAKSVGTAFTASNSGKIDAKLTFFLCTEEICKRQKDEASLPVVVE